MNKLDPFRRIIKHRDLGLAMGFNRVLAESLLHQFEFPIRQQYCQVPLSLLVQTIHIDCFHFSRVAVKLKVETMILVGTAIDLGKCFGFDRVSQGLIHIAGTVS